MYRPVPQGLLPVHTRPDWCTINESGQSQDCGWPYYTQVRYRLEEPCWQVANFNLAIPGKREFTYSCRQKSAYSNGTASAETLE